MVTDQAQENGALQSQLPGGGREEDAERNTRDQSDENPGGERDFRFF
jgi:hypothetical protein